jgi:excinuclease ABC subunit A
VRQDPESVMPWTVLGRKWHLVRKGFPPGKKVAWPPELLEELLEMLQAAAPQAQFLWNNHQTVTVFISGQREPWARVWTKKLAAIELALCGPKGQFAMGRVADLGQEPEFDATRADTDIIKLRFITEEDLHRGDLQELLRQHAVAVTEQDGKKTAGNLL